MLQGEMDVNRMEQDARRELADAGWQVDYVAVRRRRDLHKPTAEEVATREPLVVLAAAKLGTTRLIDNLEV
jgi:pantoate--beta-alanine ligase